MIWQDRVASRRLFSCLAVVVVGAVLLNSALQNLFAQNYRYYGKFNKAICSPQKADCSNCLQSANNSTLLCAGQPGCFASKCDPNAMNSHICKNATNATCSMSEGMDTTTCSGCKDWDCGCAGVDANGNFTCPKKNAQGQFTDCKCDDNAPHDTGVVWSEWRICSGA